MQLYNDLYNKLLQKAKILLFFFNLLIMIINSIYLINNRLTFATGRQLTPILLHVAITN